jgi:regulator of sigma D
MITFETLRGPFRVVDVYYPHPHEVVGLGERLAPNQIIHVRQAPFPFSAPRFEMGYAPSEVLLFDLTRDIEHLFSEANVNGRRQMKKAERVRDRIEVRRNDAEAYRDFIAIYNGFVGIKKHTEKITQKRLDALKPFADVLVAYFDKRPLCGHLSIRDERLRRVGVIWSASTRLTGEAAPNLVASVNRWLHWYEMRLYKSENMNIYDLGRIGTSTPEEAAITRFKLSFGGTRVLEHDYVMAGIAAHVAMRLLYAFRRIRSVGWKRKSELGQRQPVRPLVTGSGDPRLSS